MNVHMYKTMGERGGDCYASPSLFCLYSALTWAPKKKLLQLEGETFHSLFKTMISHLRSNLY